MRCGGLICLVDCAHWQALQDSIIQLEARASIAEAGKAAAHRQLTQVKQQLAADSLAHDAELAALAEQLAHQNAMLAGAAQYLGPLESGANPVSPVLSPRVQSIPHVSCRLMLELQDSAACHKLLIHFRQM